MTSAVPLQLLQATSASTLAPFKNTDFEERAKATFWNTAIVRHVQCIKAKQAGSAINALSVPLHAKVQSLTIASHATTMSRHISDVKETIEECPNVKNLTIEVTVPDASPYFFHEASSVARSLLHNIAGVGVNKTVIILWEPPLMPSESDIANRKFGVTNEWTTNRSINITVIHLAARLEGPGNPICQLMDDSP